MIIEHSTSYQALPLMPLGDIIGVIEMQIFIL
jgi:hypothetical protein